MTLLCQAYVLFYVVPILDLTVIDGLSRKVYLSFRSFSMVLAQRCKIREHKHRTQANSFFHELKAQPT